METALQKTVPGNLQTVTNSIPGQRAIIQMINSDPNLKKIARIIAVKVNSLYAYPLTKSQIEDWVEIIHELMPDLTAEKLDEIMNNVILGIEEWDVKKGVQNLVLAVNGTYNPMFEKIKAVKRRQRMPKIVV